MAKVTVAAGRGGNGAVSFRREKYIDKGGPDGGDGGKGGDVIVVGDPNTSSLMNFRYQPELKADNGQAGTKRDKRGKSGADLIVRVPLGTLVSQQDQPIADIVESGQKVIVARGGSGGFGNAHFKSSTRQAPRVAEVGEAGERFEATLELKLIGDVGVIGFPNAGKSTFLHAVSNARPEIADYPFTTLTPNVGVADIDDSSLLIADIPGLIEGAAEGKGLGDAFLRHIERTPVLLHLIDVYSDDIAGAYQTIRQELAHYSQDLLDRPEIVALTKIEGVTPAKVTAQIKKVRTVMPPGEQPVAISSLSKSGIPEILRQLLQVTAAARQKTELAEPQKTSLVPVIRLAEPAEDKAWLVKRDNEAFVVTGVKIEKFASRTDFTNVHSVARLRDIMRKMGISHELERQEVQGNSLIRIGAEEFSFTEQQT